MLGLVLVDEIFFGLSAWVVKFSLGIFRGVGALGLLFLFGVVTLVSGVCCVVKILNFVALNLAGLGWLLGRVRPVASASVPGMVTVSDIRRVGRATRFSLAGRGGHGGRAESVCLGPLGRVGEVGGRVGQAF